MRVLSAAADSDSPTGEKPMASVVARGLAAVFVTAALELSASGLAAEPPVAGEKTTWHGFDRYDFLMDEADLQHQAVQAPPDERTAVRAPGEGPVAVRRRRPEAGRPPATRGPGAAITSTTSRRPRSSCSSAASTSASSGATPTSHWDAWYAFLTEKHGLSKKPAFVGMSRGGRNAYTWATAHPDKVSCIYADNPAVSREAIALLGGLAKNDVPLLHVCGSLDPILGNHTLVIESVYQQLGGRISVMIKDGAAHHPHSLRDPKPIADFIEQSQRPAARRLAGLRRQGVHEDLVLRHRERLPRLPEREDVRHLSRPVVRAVLRPLRIPHRRRPDAGVGDRAEDRRPGQAVGVPGRLRDRATRRSIWPCWARASTSSPARCRPTPTARSCSSGTPSTST